MIGYLSFNSALVHAFQPRLARRTHRETLARNRVFKTAPKLSDYFHESELVAVKGEMDRPISGLAIDSRRVAPGNVFFALPGQHADGATFVDEAISRGAVAIVAQKLPAFPPSKVTFIRVADARVALARVAQRYYKFPDRDLTAIGVTGTNGKTTVAHLIRHFLSGPERVGLLGTIHYDLGARTVPSYLTTPEALDIYGMMAQMREANCRHAVMELSSHGLAQKRVHGLQFGATVFTNLTGEPAGSPETLGKYFAAKLQLFTGVNGGAPRIAVVNLDDPHGEKLAEKISRELPEVKLVTFGEHHRAHIRADNVSLLFKHTLFRLTWPGGTCEVDAPMVGRYNVGNLLAAIATAHGLGRDPGAFLGKLRTFPGVPGRLESVATGVPFNVFVDCANTEDALRRALAALRRSTPGRLRVVFGCGGWRDQAKRPLMVRMAQQFADQVFATADNPRTERLGQIFADMRGGVTAPEKISWIEDRREAIRLAIEACRPGDTLLIAGKGHETSQEFADTIFPFDDRLVVRELLSTAALIK